MFLVQTCSQTEQCTYVGGPFQGGAGEYYAVARDAAGNQGISQTMTLIIYDFIN
jgi:hypothetical protein